MTNSRNSSTVQETATEARQGVSNGIGQRILITSLFLLAAAAIILLIFL